MNDPSQVPWGDSPARWNHYVEHGRGVGANTEQEYDESARRTIREGVRFEYRERNGAPRVGYYDRVRGHFTGLDRQERRIATHFAVGEPYVRGLRNSTYR
jgi:hypothetical protein